MSPTRSTIEDATSILDTVQEAYVRLDGEFRFTFVNRAANILLGKPRAELIGKTPWGSYPETAGTPYEEALRRAKAENAVVSFENHYEPWDRWYAITAMPDSSGGLVIHFLDITERFAAEVALRDTEKRYRCLFENMQEGFAYCRMIFDGGEPKDFIYLMVNETFEALTNLTGVVGKKVTEVIPGIRESDPELFQIYGRVASTGEPHKCEMYVNGLGQWFSISLYSPEPSHFVAIFDVITERKQTEAKLRSLVTTIEQTGEAIVITDLDGTIHYCNPAFEKISGYSKEEAIGQRPSILKSGKHSAEFYKHLWATIRQGKVWTGRFTNKKKDGSLYEEDATISPIRDDSGIISGFVAVQHDVTERLQLERQLLQAQKLESVGRLAGGVAHDFNNLLTVINGYSGFLTSELNPDEQMWADANEIRKAGERAASLTKQLLAFSRKQVIEPRPLNLNSTIRDTEQMLRRLIGEDIVLTTGLDPFLGLVMADSNQIQQVLMNLVVNARDAMPEGGKLGIETANADFDHIPSGAHPAAMPGRYVAMAITDTGTGMDDNTRQHLFEPFFTTKDRDKGTGLGLSTVYGIVRQNGGWIDILTELGTGTSFKLYFPRTDASILGERDDENIAPEPSAGYTILLVEDQEAVRSFTKAVLKRYGYHVIEASHGAEALALVGQDQREIHLLLTDVVLPGMNGKDLSEHLRKLRPNLKVLFTSGYTADVIGRRGVPETGLEYIAKPFNPNELAAKVREVLADSR